MERYKRIVFANGCFDLLHCGHIEVLEKARDLGDFLFVALNSDESVRKLKGPTRPIFNQDQRKRMLLSLSCVDKVVIFTGEDELEKLIKIMTPAILVKGPEWKGKELVGQKYVESIGGRVEFVGADIDSTSDIIKRIKK